MKRLIFIFVLLLPLMVMAQRINRITNDVDVVYKTSGLRVFPNSSGDTISFKGKDGSSGNNSSIRSTTGINLHDCDSIIFLDGTSQRTAFDRVVIPFTNADLVSLGGTIYRVPLTHNLNDTFVHVSVFDESYVYQIFSTTYLTYALNSVDSLNLRFDIAAPISGTWNALISK